MQQRLCVLVVALAAFGCSSESSPPAESDSGAADTSVTVDTFVDTAETTDVAVDETETIVDTGTETIADSAADAVDAGETDPAEAGIVCNSLVVTADVPITQVATDPPPLTGGTIVDGTYVLTKLVLYTGPGGATGPRPQTAGVTLLLAGGSYEQKQLDVRGAESSSSGAITRDVSAITLTDTCADAGTFAAAFEATSTSLKLVFSSASNVELTLKKK